MLLIQHGIPCSCDNSLTVRHIKMNHMRLKNSYEVKYKTVTKRHHQDVIYTSNEIQ